LNLRPPGPEPGAL